MTHRRKNSLPSIADLRERRKQFRIALAHAGRNQDWFAAQAGIAAGTLSNCLHGRRVSAQLTAKIDGFIAKHVKKEAAQNVA